MKISKKGEYAFKALLALATAFGERTLSLREISLKEKLPVKFLEQIMMILRRAGLVESSKGKHGGYALSKSPKQITLGEVIRVIDGPLAPLASADEIQKRIQRGERHAGLYCILLDVRNAASDILDEKTLADVCEKTSELAASNAPFEMYYI